VVDEAESWDFDPTEESPEDEAYPQLQFEIVNYPADITLKGYLDQWKSGQLKVPPFQRDYVWDVKKASKLVESFLLGLPVPGVFLFRPKNSNEFQIIDGQQRILSVIKFQQEQFEEKTFRLKGVQERFEGKKFSDFEQDVQFKIETSVLRATIVQQLSPDDDTSVYQIFERLNTGGVNLNPMEIRQSVSFGPFIDLLKDLNKNKDWMAIVGRRAVDKRLRDVELVLRILALFQSRKTYDKPMKEFLNRYIEKKRSDNDDYEKIKSTFEDVASKIRSQLGDKPFHLRGKLNYGIIDSIFYGLMCSKNRDNIKNGYKILLSDKDFINAVTYNTSDASVIEVRLNKSVKAFV
jgi:uncharacterized protein with ParB-like and HNH nuclease domain